MNKATSIHETTDISGESGAQHQNIARAALILEALAGGGQQGLRLIDVTRITALNKTVAHRGLAGLVAHGLASYEADSARFFLGDRLFAWVGKSQQRFELAERAKPYLDKLADELEDTIYFAIRRGDESVCYGRAEGSFPIKTLTLNIGDRRPLGIGSGSLAIAAFQEESEVERLITEYSLARAKYKREDELIRDDIRKARENGYSLTEGYFIDGMTGVGVPIRNSRGVVVASLSMAAISRRLEVPRRQSIANRLVEEATLMELDLKLLFDQI